MLVAANNQGSLDNPFKIINIHNHMIEDTLENCNPGEIRNFLHASPAGYQYSNPDNIHLELSNFCQLNNKNVFLKHAIFELIHPFCDGNGRVGRTILCSDLNFDFEKVNNLIGKDYIEKINMYFCNITE